MGDEAGSLSERVRAACAWVAEGASSVRIAEAELERYARAIGDGSSDDPAAGLPVHELPAERRREERAALLLCLDAINFGSGWWPTIRKRPGMSGYDTIASGLAERFRTEGGWSAHELLELSPAALAGVFGQDIDHPLMALYADALKDVGEHVAGEYDGSFGAVVDAAAGSAPALAERVAAWEAFADTSEYRGEAVPFFKRAQLVAADAQRTGVARLDGLERLTAFADNLVPHVLRVDGILHLAPALARAIDAGRLLEHGSAPEVELRACAVHAIERLVDRLDRQLCAAQVDSILWNRGRGAAYKAVPRPRCRTTAY